jgi:glycosyltransferase involved in cell wall biosynthesis
MSSGKKIAIVSSYNESCGNASYTHVLKNAFGVYGPCTVMALDLFLLQKSHPAFSKAGDRHIKDISVKLGEFDYVNIQFEAGLYGANNAQILRRLNMLLQGCRNVVVTLHRVDPPGMFLPTALWRGIEMLGQGHPIKAWRFITEELFYRRPTERLYDEVVKLCKRRAKGANVWIAVHTKRERRLVEEIYRFDRVFDFPITFLTEEQRLAVWTETNAANFHRRHAIPSGAKVIGAFGFISSYKGYETLIEALRLLPDNYHLYLFGGQHPGTVSPNVRLDAYIESLIKLVDQKTTEVLDDLRRRLAIAMRRRGDGKEAFADGSETIGAVRTLLQFDLRDRVHFVGELADPQFIEALRACDAVVLPYLEVGQSMSGVIALAIECGANLFCARNKSFSEVARYYGEVFTSFDIGNYVELAQKLSGPDRRFESERVSALARYNLTSNVAMHMAKLTCNDRSEVLETGAVGEGAVG